MGPWVMISACWYQPARSRRVASIRASKASMRGLLERQADIVEAVQQAVLAERIDLER